jgi:glutathione S-transferase
MTKLELIGTPLSHFTRKVRILLHELGVDYEFVRAPGVMATETAPYGEHPLMRVPTLRHGDATVLESDHIARYVAAKFDPDDRFAVRGEAVEDLNRLAVINGVMDNEVVWILAGRGGLTHLEDIVYFRKLRAAIDNGLGWLDREVEPERERFDYGDIAMICMWQHIAYYRLVPDLERYARLGARVARFVDRPSIAATAPEVALAEARAAGWQPG